MKSIFGDMYISAGNGLPNNTGFDSAGDNFSAINAQTNSFPVPSPSPKVSPEILKAIAIDYSERENKEEDFYAAEASDEGENFTPSISFRREAIDGEFFGAAATGPPPGRMTLPFKSARVIELRVTNNSDQSELIDILNGDNVDKENFGNKKDIVIASSAEFTYRRIINSVFKESIEVSAIRIVSEKEISEANIQFFQLNKFGEVIVAPIIFKRNPFDMQNNVLHEDIRLRNFEIGIKGYFKLRMPAKTSYSVIIYSTENE